MTAPAGPAADSATPAAPAPEAKQETFPLSYVQELRDEAANYRTKAKTAAEEAKAEVIKEYEGKLSAKDTEFSELKTAHSEAELSLLKLNKVLEAKIPVDDVLEVVALVQGRDEESVSASVERVKALLGKAPVKIYAVDPTQGSGSGAIPLNGNPVLKMLKSAVGAD